MICTSAFQEVPVRQVSLEVEPLQLLAKQLRFGPAAFERLRRREVQTAESEPRRDVVRPKRDLLREMAGWCSLQCRKLLTCGGSGGRSR